MSKVLGQYLLITLAVHASVGGGCLCCYDTVLLRLLLDAWQCGGGVVGLGTSATSSSYVDY